MDVRQIQVEDAKNFLSMLKALDTETEYMMFEPGERQVSEEGMGARVKGMIEAGDLVLVAEERGEIIGFLSAERHGARRIRHTAYIVVGIREGYRGKGIGTRFFEELDQWAVASGVTRIELTVMCPNAVAKHLYEKNGFEIEGIKKKAMVVNGQYIDEYYMAKML